MKKVDYRIDLISLDKGYDGESAWFQTAVGIIPPKTAVWIMTRAKVCGDDVFTAVQSMRSDDCGKSWTKPQPQKTLDRRTFKDEVFTYPCDMTPMWHPQTGKLVAIGHTVCYVENSTSPLVGADYPIYVSYSVYNEKENVWNEWKILEPNDKNKWFYFAGGCSVGLTLPNGDILQPVYGLDKQSLITNGWEACMNVVVLRLKFDGETLTIIEEGNVLSVPEPRGLAEPSITFYNNKYYMTIRNDVCGYVAVSDDGLHFSDPIPWTFDDGSELGNYNTQQHWITHSDGLFLSYNRRGADNDHIIRHRAPTFIAEVDIENLCVIRETEKEVIPNKGGQQGNFRTINVSKEESWVVVADYPLGDSENPYNIEISLSRGCENDLYLCRLLWDKPNELFDY